MNDDVVAPIASHLAEWNLPHVEMAIHGFSDAGRVAAALDDFCRRELGSAPRETLFYRSSIGAVAGLELVDGRKVVIKAHQADWTFTRLVEVTRFQSRIASELGLAPDVLHIPAPLGKGFATVEELVQRGDVPDGHRPTIRRALAQSLHAVVEVLAPYLSETSLPPSLLTSTSSRSTLWPTPHSKLFDFETTRAGAEYIDTIAAQARAHMVSAGRRVIGHSDWRAEHVRFDGDTPVIAFDWDSLSHEHEAALVGMTAHMFCADWSRDDVRQTPTLDEARAFLADYEAASRTPFTRAERELCGAAFAYAVAYTSRCGHASGIDTREESGTFQHLLATHGAKLLDL